MKSIVIPVLLAAFCGVIWTGCNKNDMGGALTAEDRSAEKFFNSYASSKPAVTALQQYAERENTKLPFVKQMMMKAGIPRWDKALVFENVKTTTGRRNELDENTTVIHVPMVPENDSMVQGSLMVRMSAEDTVMNLVAAQDYASYGFGAAPAGGWNAHDVFTVLTKLDNMVFGRTIYRVTDGRIFGDSQQVHRKVTINHDVPDPNLNDLFVVLTFTTSQTVCIIAGEPGSSPGVCTTFILTTYLYVQIPDGDGGGGGGGTGGGPTGGGGTGGTGGPIGWVPWEDDPAPCNLTCDEATALLNSISATGGNAVQYTEGSIIPPDAEGIERKPKAISWEFLILNFGWGSHAEYSAYFTGVVFRNNSTSPWKWQTINYANQITQSSGHVPGCLSVTVTGVVSGPVISADKSRAVTSIAWVAQGTIGCGLGIQGGTQNGTVNNQTFLANH